MSTEQAWIERAEKAEAELAVLRQAVIDDVTAGRLEVDKTMENEPDGYDSLRFADTRHGWIFSTLNVRKLVPEAASRAGEVCTAREDKISDLTSRLERAQQESAAWEFKAKAGRHMAAMRAGISDLTSRLERTRAVEEWAARAVANRERLGGCVCNKRDPHICEFCASLSNLEDALEAASIRSTITSTGAVK